MANAMYYYEHVLLHDQLYSLVLLLRRVSRACMASAMFYLELFDRAETGKPGRGHDF